MVLREGTQSDSSLRTVKWVIAGSTILVAVVGLFKLIQVEAIGLLAVVLLPPGLLATLIRRSRTILVCAGLTLLLSTLPWAIIALGHDQWTGLAILGYPVVLSACIGGAVLDERSRKQSDATTPPASH